MVGKLGSKEFVKIISPDENDRLRLKIVVEKGTVVDIVVQYEARFEDKWHSIVRYDCSHGFFHRDVLHPNGDKDKYPIPINNLNDALLYAEQDIKDRWKWYRDRFRKEMK